jgi:hypothetical protein
MPRIFLDGQEEVKEKKITAEDIWKDVENYRGNHEMLKFLFDDLDKPVYKMVTNGEHYVTRNVNGVTKKVQFYLYTAKSWENTKKYNRGF